MLVSGLSWFLRWFEIVGTFGGTQSFRDFVTYGSVIYRMPDARDQERGLLNLPKGKSAASVFVVSHV